MSHPAEFPKGWNRVGRQNETCGRDWRAPSIYACIPNPLIERWAGSAAAREGWAASTWKGTVGKSVSPGVLGPAN